MPAPWIEKQFSFDEMTEADFPSLVDRLRATPARIEDVAKNVPRELLTRRDGESWSLQEHVGHLVEVDALHEGRLDDYRARVSVLRPADMENKRTKAARYNDRRFDDVMTDLRRVRGQLVDRLDTWEPDQRVATALHPRLQKPMRVVDMLLFAVEHDAHHLARMEELARGGSYLAGK